MTHKSCVGAITAVLRCRAVVLGVILAAGPGVRFAAAQPSVPIQHVIVIMQENRSFDSYFGTFPGADGIPSGVCVPLDPANPAAGCVVPFHDPHDMSLAGPHVAASAQADLDDGITTSKLDGFVQQQTKTIAKYCSGSSKPDYCSDTTALNRHDVMGYHTDAEIFNYWAYARRFVLQDRMFESVRDWSQSAHLDLTSEWAATCSNYAVTSTCVSGNVYPLSDTNFSFPWVSLFQLLDVHDVSWKYYIATGQEPDCDDDEMTCVPVVQNAGILSIWNPTPGFAWVKAQGAAYLSAHNQNLDHFLLDVKGGTLPQVAWVIPDLAHSEHPGNSGVTAGMVYVTSLVNAVLQSPYWANTAIFVSWDDWGGFYDHVVPPNVDRNASKTPIQGFGLRVPGLLISAYAKPATIDHQLLSFDNYAVFIEDLFTGGARLDPTALGNPDHRPDLRDELQTASFADGHTESVGNLMNEFDFSQKPQPPLVLPTHIPIALHLSCRTLNSDTNEVCTSPTVRLFWDTDTTSSTEKPVTYHVTRDFKDVPTCTGTKTSCSDTPGSGVHLYRAYAVGGTSGVATPASAAAEADEP